MMSILSKSGFQIEIKIIYFCFEQKKAPKSTSWLLNVDWVDLNYTGCVETSDLPAKNQNTIKVVFACVEEALDVIL